MSCSVRRGKLKDSMVTASLDKVRRYGLVALAFLHIAVSRGLHGTFGVFFVAMLDTFGWSGGATAGAISLAIVFEGMCLPVRWGFDRPHRLA